MTRKSSKFYSLFLTIIVSFSAYGQVEETKNPISLSHSPLNSGVPLDAGAGLLKVSLGLIIVILAIFVTAWLYRRYGNFQRASGHGLKIVGGLSIGNRERVVLLQVGEEQLLLGVTPNRIDKLMILKEPLSTSEENSPPPLNKQFANRLSDAIRQRAGK